MNAHEQYEEVRARLERGDYASAEAYYADKDMARRLGAAIAGKSESKYDPMGYWFGMQSA